MPSDLSPEKSFDIPTYWDIERVYTRTTAMQHGSKHSNPGLRKKSDTIGRNRTWCLRAQGYYCTSQMAFDIDKTELMGKGQCLWSSTTQIGMGTARSKWRRDLPCREILTPRRHCGLRTILKQGGFLDVGGWNVKISPRVKFTERPFCWGHSIH